MTYGLTDGWWMLTDCERRLNLWWECDVICLCNCVEDFVGSKAYCFVVKTMMWKLQNVSKCLIVHDWNICWPTIVWQAGDLSFATCGRVVHPLYAVWFQECLAYSRWGTGSLFACCTKGFSYVQWAVFAIDTICLKNERDLTHWLLLVDPCCSLVANLSFPVTSRQIHHSLVMWPGKHL